MPTPELDFMSYSCSPMIQSTFLGYKVAWAKITLVGLQVGPSLQENLYETNFLLQAGSGQLGLQVLSLALLLQDFLHFPADSLAFWEARQIKASNMSFVSRLAFFSLLWVFLGDLGGAFCMWTHRPFFVPKLSAKPTSPPHLSTCWAISMSFKLRRFFSSSRSSFSTRLWSWEKSTGRERTRLVCVATKLLGWFLLSQNRLLH